MHKPLRTPGLDLALGEFRGYGGRQAGWRKIVKKNDELQVFRENSVYWVVFLSNEDDYSISPVWYYQRDMWEALQPLSREHLRFSSIVIEDIDDCSNEVIQEGGREGPRYIALSEHSEGAIVDLCQDNIYAKLKEEIDDFFCCRVRCYSPFYKISISSS